MGMFEKSVFMQKNDNLVLILSKVEKIEFLDQFDLFLSLK